MLDLIIRNGRVYDGTGNPWTKLDVGLAGGRIVALGKLPRERSAETIDARGMAVAPGFIKTDMTTEFVNNPEASARILEVVPLKRFGESTDIANMTAYLCSEEANYITGQVFNVDGGMAM